MPIVSEVTWKTFEQLFNFIKHTVLLVCVVSAFSWVRGAVVETLYLILLPFITGPAAIWCASHSWFRVCSFHLHLCNGEMLSFYITQGFTGHYVALHFDTMSDYTLSYYTATTGIQIRRDAPQMLAMPAELWLPGGLRATPKVIMSDKPSIIVELAEYDLAAMKETAGGTAWEGQLLKFGRFGPDLPFQCCASKPLSRRSLKVDFLESQTIIYLRPLSFFKNERATPSNAS